MKFLCLAYGNEADWNALSKQEQSALLKQDEVLRARGDLVAAVHPDSTVLRAPNGIPSAAPGPLTHPGMPLAGFGIIEAADFDELITLLTNTPCARAGGAIEIRPVVAMNEWHTGRLS